MPTAVDEYVPDFGLEAPVAPHGYGNPWLDEMPMRWVAPHPDGYHEAEEALRSLRDEAESIEAHITTAARAGDGVALVALRARRDVLPTLISAAEVAFLTVKLRHLEASRALTVPHSEHLERVERDKQQALRRAQAEAQQVGQARISTFAARWALEAETGHIQTRLHALMFPAASRADVDELTRQRDADAEWAAVQAEAQRIQQEWDDAHAAYLDVQLGGMADRLAAAAHPGYRPPQRGKR